MTDDFETVVRGTVKKVEKIEACLKLNAQFMMDLEALMDKLAQDLGEILDE